MSTHFPDTPDSFTGFDEAHHALMCFDARAHVKLCFEQTDFLLDERIDYIHVDNTSRLDRMQLTAFDAEGDILRSYTLYNDDGKGLEATHQFEFPFARLLAKPGSELAALTEDGWIVDAPSLRSYDIIADKRATQKVMLLANLRDMILAGDARCLMFAENLMGSAEVTESGSER